MSRTERVRKILTQLTAARQVVLGLERELARELPKGCKPVVWTEDDTEYVASDKGVEFHSTNHELPERS